MNQNKLVTILAGMAVLAGLAYHQVGVKAPTPEEESILVGTSIDTVADVVTSEQDAPAAERSDPDGCETHAMVQETPSANDCDSSLAKETPPQDAPRERKG